MADETTLPSALEELRIIDVGQFAKALGLSVAHTRRLTYQGKLPKPVRIGARKVGWPAATVRALIAERMAEADAPAP